MNRLSVSMNRNELRFGWLYYPIQFLFLPLLIEIVFEKAGFPLSAAWLNTLYFILNFCFILLIFRKFLKKNLKVAVHKPFICLLFAVAGVFTYMILGELVGLLILKLKPDFFNVNDSYINQMVRENSVLLPLSIIFLVPVAEEALYRGLMFGAIYNRNKVLAFTVSTLAFAAIHVIGYIGHYPPSHLALCLLQYLPAGLTFGLVYAITDTIWTPILMHIFINAIGMLSMR